MLFLILLTQRQTQTGFLNSVNYVVGMSGSITDIAAIEFAKGFYSAIGAGRSVEFAHKLGCAAIKSPEKLVPILKMKMRGEVNSQGSDQALKQDEEELLEAVRSEPTKNNVINQTLMNYDDFQILVTADRKIRAASAQGDEWGELQLNMNRIKLTLKLIEQRQTNVDLLKGLGSELYQALFPANVGSQLRATIASAQADGYNVRLRLVFESSELTVLPWEFLYDDRTNTFLANNTETVLSRYIDIPLQKRDLKTASLPLKILLVISSPINLTQLDVAEEERLIREALAKHIDAGQIELDVLREATIRNINQKLREKTLQRLSFYRSWCL